MTSLKRSLDIVGEIRAVRANEVVRVSASHDTITVDLPRLRAVQGSIRSLGGKARRAKAIGSVDAGLHCTNLSVQFRLANKIIARLGTDARPGLLSRLLGRVLGVTPLEIRPAIVTALFKSRRL